MREGKRTRRKAPKRTDQDKGPERPSGGKFAPIIEELGKMKTRLEAGAVTFSPRPLSLQEKTQIEIEGELIQREQTVRDDFGTVFSDNPQALVEFIAAMRRYGGDEILRDLVFAAETLYGGEVDKMPGGVQFWEDLKKEVGTIPYEPGTDPDDERLHRILAVEILREAALSYDIISSGMEPEEEATGQADTVQQAGTVPLPVEPPAGEGDRNAEEASSEQDGPVAVQETPQPGSVAGAPRSGAAGRIHAQLDIMARKDADIRQALMELSRREGVLQKDMERLQKLSLQSIDTEEQLKLEREELVQREQRLLAVEKEFSDRERILAETEADVSRRLAGHEEERGRLLERERELSTSLEETRASHMRAGQELEAVRREVEEAKNAIQEGRLREEALAAEKRAMEEEHARLSDIKARFEAEQERQGKLEKELARNSALREELDLKERRLKVMEDETSAIKTELEMRKKDLEETERTLKSEAERWERDLGEREERLASRERELSSREAVLPGQKDVSAPAPRSPPAPLPPAATPAAPSPPPAPPVARSPPGPSPFAPSPPPSSPVAHTTPASSAQAQTHPAQHPQTPSQTTLFPPMSAGAALSKSAPPMPPQSKPAPPVPPPSRSAPPRPPQSKSAPPSLPPSGKAQSSLAPPPSPQLLPHRKEPPAIPPTEPAGAHRPFYKVKCPGCRTIIVVTSQERPLKIKCTNCGKEGVLK